MKKIKCILSLLVLFSASAYSQTSDETILMTDPATNCQQRYRYYPNLEAYFDNKENVYIYAQKGAWIKSNEIPSGYRGYSLYNKTNVVITDYDDDNPTQFIKLHKKKYPYVFHRKSPAVTER